MAQPEETPAPSDDDVFAAFRDLGAPEPVPETPPKEVPFTQIDGPVEMPDAGKKAPRNTALKRSLEQTYVMLGTSVFMFDQQIGGLIINESEKCAASLDELAKTNPKVRRALEKLMETSVYGAVIAAHAPIAVAIATKYVPYLRQSYEQTVQNVNDMRENAPL